VRATLALFLLGLALGCERTPPASEAAPVPAPLAADLEAVRAARVFFAHMSVGANVLDGVARIPDSGIALAERPIDSGVELPARTFSHALFGQNGDPDAKIAAFEKALAELRPSPDVALMKFCYADMTASTDTHALFTHYREALARLRAAHPATVFVPVTAPLTVRDTGAKDLIKRWTGLSDRFAQANVRRDEYNARLRAAYRGEPIFDLAAIESHWPDGRAETFSRGTESYPSLVPAYSDDGHHLAGAGQDRAAAALVQALAEALRRGPAK
jgi:lysophospholipase L1-like esterase